MPRDLRDRGERRITSKQTDEQGANIWAASSYAADTGKISADFMTILDMR
jgi:hypothetical protein